VDNSPLVLVQHLINGLTLGGIYALIALGYTMVYGILKFINFAHGEIMMSGTFVGLLVYNAIRGMPGLDAPPGVGVEGAIVPFFLAMLVSMLFAAALGVTVERLAYRPLRRATRLAPLLSAIGVSIILINLAGLVFGTRSHRFEYPFDNSPIHIGALVITPHQILILAVSVVLMVGLKLFVDYTRMGKAMRATSSDFDTARLMGINGDTVISLTFAIGSALGAVAGVLIALDYKVYPTLGTLAGLKAFIAAVVGGIGNITGAMIGGLILGILETFGVALLGIPVGLKDTIAFVILIIILLVKPSGIMGKKTREKV
jgi:branched-chain amino acid transport system permease protein